MKPPPLQIILLTTFAMVAFASNSLLNRLALGQRSIDATSYTTIRLASGAVTLFAIAYLQRKNNRAFLRGSWTSATLLFIYAITFSFAYLSLSAGTGALILFGSVQATMILVAVRSGEHPSPLEWIGLLFALGGLVYLVSPGLAAPLSAWLRVDDRGGDRLGLLYDARTRFGESAWGYGGEFRFIRFRWRWLFYCPRGGASQFRQAGCCMRRSPARWLRV